MRRTQAWLWPAGVVGDLGLLEDHPAQALDRLGQAAHQATGMNDRAFRGVEGGDGSSDPDALRQGLAAKPGVVG